MTALVDIVATDAQAGADGREVDRFLLPHGAEPVEALAARGWVPVRAAGTGTDHGLVVSRPWAEPLAGLAPTRSAHTEPGQPWTVTITYAVRAAAPVTAPAALPVSRDPGLSPADVSGARVYQRVAAYAIVSSRCGLLLTELSDATSAAGQWNLPGGGLDEGEAVDAGLHREIWEETGQRVEEATLLGVLSSHWVGRAPSGGVEDYHAVRLIHRTRCKDPTVPVIHDVGGSTSRAQWVPWTEVGQVPLVGSFAPLIREVTTRHLAGS